jgi:hypothetical protein
MKVRQQETSFCEQKEAKKLFYSGACGGSAALPHHQARFKKSFWVLFSKSTAYFFAIVLNLNA